MRGLSCSKNVFQTMFDVINQATRHRETPKMTRVDVIYTSLITILLSGAGFKDELVNN